MRKKILVFIDWFLPAYKAGGPIKSVANIVTSLKDECDFYIVTSNTDLDTSAAFGDVEPNIWTENHNAHIIYISKENQTTRFLKQLIQSLDFDVAYFNSLFSTRFTLMPLRVIRQLRPQAKIILAPRGMLGEGALKIKSFKKKIFLQATKLLHFFDNVTWHVSSSQEANEVKGVFGAEANTQVAMNITLATENMTVKAKQVNQLKMFFLSRVSQKKNLLEAIQILQNVKDDYEITFSVIGPIEDEMYWEICKQEAEKLPQHVLFYHKGSIPNSELSQELKNKHVLLFPTFHENYGHVIVEALSNGCPVLISDKTPWHNLESMGVGADIPLEQTHKFVEMIEQFAAMDKATFQIYTENCLKFVREKVCDKTIVEENKKLFLS